MSYSHCVARSGYRKMPCRQTHYKYDTEEERDSVREEKKQRIKEKNKVRKEQRGQDEEGERSPEA